MKTLLLISFLAASVVAQALVVEPTRVSLADEGTLDDKQFNELLRAELNAWGTVRFTQARFDYKVLTATAPITSGGKVVGYSAAAAVLTPGESKEVGLKLHITVAPSLDVAAKDVGAFLDKELKRRRRK